MGYSVDKSEIQYTGKISHRKIESVTHNTRVALWQLPYNSHYKDYDEDGSKWFESRNREGDDEIKPAEEGLNMSFARYKVSMTTIWYDDNTFDVVNKFPNNTMIENHGKNHIFIRIKDNSGNIAADKIFGFDSNEGRKTIYKHYKQGENTFTVVKVYSYDTNKNRATDVVNFGYTSDPSKLTSGCDFENEYYMLNGKEVNVKIDKNGNFIVKDEDGKKLTFQVE